MTAFSAVFTKYSLLFEIPETLAADRIKLKGKVLTRFMKKSDGV
jgi:hypothetical protein